ncbi:MAG: hypothetical protein M9921_01730 [Fimbriimonadaceae bacterium]|nr:hypothetical protein [Fimbriimonadaceae bacterium]
MLALRGQAWTGREECAARLYPDSPGAGALNALRQTIFRLRRWLGPGAIESDGHRLRLRPGAVGLDLRLPDGREASGALIAPGIAHPWLDAIRDEVAILAPGEPATDPSPAEAYVMAVEEVSRVDVDAARCLLIGGREMAQIVDPDRMLELMRRTRPRRRTDVCAVEHLEFQGELLYRDLALQAAQGAFRKANRLALWRGDRMASLRTEAMLGFALLESGLIDEADTVAQEWLSKTRRGAAANVICQSYAAERLWHRARFADALAILAEVRGRVDPLERHAQLGFWCNYALLAAEAGELERVQEGAEFAKSLYNPRVDRWATLMLGLAEGEELMARRRPEEALQRLASVGAEARRQGYPLRSLYAKEAEAEAWAKVGNGKQALSLWRSAEGIRRRAGLLPTPRLQDRKRRLLNLA